MVQSSSGQPILDEGANDKFNRPISVGDFVVFSVCSSSSVNTRAGDVVDIRQARTRTKRIAGHPYADDRGFVTVQQYKIKVQPYESIYMHRQKETPRPVWLGNLSSVVLMDRALVAQWLDDLQRDPVY